ncbi:MAG: hypothetical protein IJ038_07425 [Clostridia bacterium]|nr:hypothetical protein [Clostridia bacterium]
MTFHRRNDTPKSAVLKRVAAYGILFFILGVAQCSFFTNLSFLSAVPDIVLGAVAAVALLDTQKTAAICGIASGFMIDALGGSGLSLSPIVYFAIALICSELSKKMLQSFLSWIFVLAAASVLNSLFTYAYISLSFENAAFSAVFKSILLPEALTTAVFSLPIFFIVKLCVRIAEAKNKFKM